VSFFANSAGFAILKNSFAKPEILLCNSFDQGWGAGTQVSGFGSSSRGMRRPRSFF